MTLPTLLVADAWQTLQAVHCKEQILPLAQVQCSIKWSVAGNDLDSEFDDSSQPAPDPDGRTSIFALSSSEQCRSLICATLLVLQHCLLCAPMLAAPLLHPTLTETLLGMLSCSSVEIHIAVLPVAGMLLREAATEAVQLDVALDLGITLLRYWTHNGPHEHQLMPHWQLQLADFLHGLTDILIKAAEVVTLGPLLAQVWNFHLVKPLARLRICWPKVCRDCCCYLYICLQGHPVILLLMQQDLATAALAANKFPSFQLQLCRLLALVFVSTPSSASVVVPAMLELLTSGQVPLQALLPSVLYALKGFEPDVKQAIAGFGFQGANPGLPSGADLDNWAAAETAANGRFHSRTSTQEHEPALKRPRLGDGQGAPASPSLPSSQQPTQVLAAMPGVSPKPPPGQPCAAINQLAEALGPTTRTSLSVGKRLMLLKALAGSSATASPLLRQQLGLVVHGWALSAIKPASVTTPVTARTLEEVALILGKLMDCRGCSSM